MEFKNAALVAGFVILWASSAWAGKSYSSDDLYSQAQKSYYQLIRISSDKQQFRHHWENVIRKFSKVVQRYPKSPEAYKATFTIARLYQRLNRISKNSSDLDQALHYYKKVSRDFSPGTLTDDALFELAEILRVKKDFSSAAGVFKTIFIKYPKGDQAKEARLQYQKLVSIVPVVKKQTKPKLSAPLKKVFLKDEKKGKKAHLIVVDAGHGGKDPGAKSPHRRLYEKDVNLRIARHVKSILENRFKYRVVMTREDDTFISLKERSEIAKKLKERSKIANHRNKHLFVSIHANASKRESAYGIETYFLEDDNVRAKETAARENREPHLKSDKGDIQEILAKLIAANYHKGSSSLAEIVQKNLFRSSRKKFRESKNLRAKPSPFYVVDSVNMPSILVEVGFLTNRKESSMLSKPDYLYRLASSIAEGIHEYLQGEGPSV